MNRFLSKFVEIRKSPRSLSLMALLAVLHDIRDMVVEGMFAADCNPQISHVNRRRKGKAKAIDNN